MTEPDTLTAHEPVILHEGRYRMYGNPDGGIHIVYKKDGEETEEHFEMPGALISMGKQLSEGKLNPMEAMKGIASLVAKGRL